MEEQRESVIRLWFSMWLRREDLGILDIFDSRAVYAESWGPEYTGEEEIRHWFMEWNTRGRVLRWDIRQFFHKGDQTAVEWVFQNQMDDGRVESFEGMSLVAWTPEGRIAALKEFGCNENRYDPYASGPEPQFREEAARWF